MSFWLNDNRFIVYTRQVKLIHKFLFSICLFFVLFSCWLFLFYLPARCKIYALTPQVSELQKKSLNLKNVIKLFDKEIELNEDLHIKFERFSKLTVDVKSFSNFLISSLKRHNISCLRINPLSSQTIQSFNKNYFYLGFKCKYQDFCEFCSDKRVLYNPLKFCYLKIFRWKDGRIKVDAIFRNISIVDA